MKDGFKIGSLNREITVQRKVVTQEQVYGTDAVSWEPLSALPGSPVVAERFAAEVVDQAGSISEGVLNGDLQVSRRLVKVRLRWRNDIDSSMRVIVHGDTDRTLQIVGGPFEIGGRKVGIELLCMEISV